MLQIPLTRGLFAIVDDADGPLVSQFKWHASAASHAEGFYACACLGKAQAKQVGRRHLKMHRLIMGYPAGLIDHKNSNGLDNRRENLRLCDDTTNQHNKRKLRPASSPYKGVSWHNGGQRWQAFICVDGHNQYLGEFRDPAAAAAVYDAAALKHFGEFACVNFPNALGETRTPTAVTATTF